jgi:hypothetical protein
MATAWARSRASRRASTAFVWVRTVSVERPRRLAAGQRATAAILSGGVDERLGLGRRVHRAVELLRRRALRDVGGGAGLHGLGGRLALRPGAVGDDPQAGARLAQRLDRGGAGRRPVLAVLGASQVDDRDIELAEVGEHLNGVGAVRGLLNLEALREQAAYPQAYQGMAIDNKTASLVTHSVCPRSRNHCPETQVRPVGCRSVRAS